MAFSQSTQRQGAKTGDPAEKAIAQYFQIYLET